METFAGCLLIERRLQWFGRGDPEPGVHIQYSWDALGLAPVRQLARVQVDPEGAAKTYSSDMQSGEEEPH